MAEKLKVRPDCIYASNPFHECTDYCSRKMAERKMQKDQKNAGSFGRKNKGSRPKPPISTFGPSEVHSPTSHVSPKKKTESRNGGGSISSAKPYSEESGVKDLYYSSDEQLESSQIFLPPETLITPAYQKDSPKTKKSEEKLKKLPPADAIGESPVVSAFGSSFSFLGIDHTLEDEDEEEVESVTSESSVTVGKYRVKASFSSILQSIFDKYGDIATTCKLESQAMRSYYLECLCYVVQELQCTPFKNLSKSKIKQLMAILKDVESSEMYVNWLSGTVNEIAEAFELSNQHRLMEEEKLNCDRDMESLQKDLEAQMEDLKMKEKEISNAKEGVEETRTRLSQLEQKCSLLNEIILSIQSKTDIVFDQDALVNLN